MQLAAPGLLACMKKVLSLHDGLQTTSCAIIEIESETLNVDNLVAKYPRVCRLGCELSPEA